MSDRGYCFLACHCCWPLCLGFISTDCVLCLNNFNLISLLLYFTFKSAFVCVCVHHVFTALWLIPLLHLSINFNCTLDTRGFLSPTSFSLEQTLAVLMKSAFRKLSTTGNIKTDYFLYQQSIIGMSF